MYLHRQLSRPLLSALLITALLTGSMLVPLRSPGSPAPVQAQGGLPPPHLGYGIHIGPYNDIDPAMINELRVDWVKLYDESQIGLYPGKRILFRMDLPWPNNWEAFRNGVRQRATALTARGVDAIEVHNEPNLQNEWPHGPNAWEFTQMLRVAYTQIKAVAPGVVVVSGGLAPTFTAPDRSSINDLEFAAEMLDNGAAQWFDAFGYHPYGYNNPPEAEPGPDQYVFRRVELIREMFEARGIYDKQIWLTEFGWLRDPAEDGVRCSDSNPDFAGFAWLRVSAEQQADYTVRAFDWADRYWPWAGPMFLWNLNWPLYSYDISPPCDHMRWFGMLRRDGSRLPVFEQFARAPRRFSSYLPQLTLFAQTLSVESSVYCPGSVPVGEFVVANSGYPGDFVAQVEVASPPGGPPVEVYPERVSSGDTVQVFADTTGLEPTLYIIYLNVVATINGELVGESIQGYVVVNDSEAFCYPE